MLAMTGCSTTSTAQSHEHAAHPQGAASGRDLGVDTNAATQLRATQRAAGGPVNIELHRENGGTATTSTLPVPKCEQLPISLSHHRDDYQVLVREPTWVDPAHRILALHLGLHEAYAGGTGYYEATWLVQADARELRTVGCFETRLSRDLAGDWAPQWRERGRAVSTIVWSLGVANDDTMVLSLESTSVDANMQEEFADLPRSCRLQMNEASGRYELEKACR